MSYAELFCQSNFSFLTGASSPEQLVKTASELGYQALAITDECSVAGVVRAYRCIREQQLPLQLIVGSFLQLPPDLQLVLLCPNRAAYAELCRIITNARRRADKGRYQLNIWDLKSSQHCLAIWLPQGNAHDKRWGSWLLKHFAGRLYLGQQRLLTAADAGYQQHCQLLASELKLPACAVGAVLMHQSSMLPLQHVLTAIRLGTTVAQAGFALQPNAERCLRPLSKLQRLFSKALLQQSCTIAALCQFSLGSLQYEYPAELVPEGSSASDYLQQLVDNGARQRFPDGVPADIQQLINKEMALITELHYPYYFLTIADLVQFAKSQQILYQGRGSAANSVVCYCLGITAVDPRKISVLFERFISRERAEPPDIDVDFEHERREEVIQYIYQKYGRQRAALAATVVSYRFRSSLRDVGKALGFHPLQLEQWLQQINRRDNSQSWWQQLLKHGLDPADLKTQQLIELIAQIRGFPRHLSQHVGGFVISAGPLYELVPVENASMDERTVIQWDKDDLETLGLLKVDVLALGMLSALRKCLQLVQEQHQRTLTLADISNMGDDPAVYQMIQQANTVGLFQIESRAQMSMLPRLKPACFYDLVIQIAIVRPGPIQGDMVHPFLRRRAGLEAISYPSQELEQVLGRTMGVPIFQEQVIKLAMVAAGFSGGEADQLRRAMASWKKTGELEQFRPKLIQGMLARGYSQSYAEQIFQQICGFGEYGFPESHSASFALLAYASAWLKHYYPLEFFVSLLNSLPMGFYSASQLVQDAKRQGIVVLPVCIQHSALEHQIEQLPAPQAEYQIPGQTEQQAEATQPQQSRYKGAQRALRLGLTLVKGLQPQKILHTLALRPTAGFPSLTALKQTALSQADLDKLASADALLALCGHRYASRWQLQDTLEDLPLFAGYTATDITIQNDSSTQSGSNRQSDSNKAACPLPAPSAIAALVEDYRQLGLSLKQHPMALLRQAALLPRTCKAADLPKLANQLPVQVAGVVTCRQSPGTAGGVTFMTLEDETGMVNVVVWRAIAQRDKTAFLTSRLLMVAGQLQRSGEVIHIIAGQLQSIDKLLPELAAASRDFH